MTKAEDRTAGTRGKPLRDSEDRELRALLFEAHRSDPQAPSFRRMWARAVAATAAPARSTPWRWAWAGAGILGAALLVLALLWGLPGGERFPTGTPSHLAALQPGGWGSTWAGWQGPLDFLLDTPGRTYLESVPTFAGSSSDDVLRATPGRERRTLDAL